MELVLNLLTQGFCQVPGLLLVGSVGPGLFLIGMPYLVVLSLGVEQARRDDLESLAYLDLYCSILAHGDGWKK